MQLALCEPEWGKLKGMIWMCPHVCCVCSSACECKHTAQERMHPCRQLAALFYIGCTDKNEVSLHSAWEREKKGVMKAWPMPVLHAEIGHAAYTSSRWTAAARMSSLSVQMLIVHKHRYERLGCGPAHEKRLNEWTLGLVRWHCCIWHGLKWGRLEWC